MDSAGIQRSMCQRSSRRYFAMRRSSTFREWPLGAHRDLSSGPNPRKARAAPHHVKILARLSVHAPGARSTFLRAARRFMCFS